MKIRGSQGAGKVRRVGPAQGRDSGGAKARCSPRRTWSIRRRWRTRASGPVVLFARNRLCALVRPGLSVTRETLLERMLDPQVKLGTSTPKADPSGDYAFEAFRKAEASAEARTALEAKALQLTGGAASAAPPAGRSPYGWHIAEGRADIFSPTARPPAMREGKSRPANHRAAGRVRGRRGLRLDRDGRCLAGAYQFAMFILSIGGPALSRRSRIFRTKSTE